MKGRPRRATKGGRVFLVSPRPFPFAFLLHGVSPSAEASRRKAHRTFPPVVASVVPEPSRVAVTPLPPSAGPDVDVVVRAGGILAASAEKVRGEGGPAAVSSALSDLAEAMLALVTGPAAEAARERGRSALARAASSGRLSPLDLASLTLVERIVAPLVDVAPLLGRDLVDVSPLTEGAAAAVGAEVTSAAVELPLPEGPPDVVVDDVPAVVVDDVPAVADPFAEVMPWDLIPDPEPFADQAPDSQPVHAGVDLEAIVIGLRADPRAMRLRLLRLRQAFAEARRVYDGLLQVLPPLHPSVSWVKGHVVPDAESPTGLREHTGWVDRRKDRPYTDLELRRLLIAGYSLQVDMYERYATSLEALQAGWSDLAADDPRKAAVTAALEAFSVVVESVRATSSMHDFWRARLVASSKLRLSEETDSPVSNPLDPGAPWIAVAIGNGDVSDALAERFERTRGGFAWAGGDSPAPVPEGGFDEAYMTDVDRVAAILLEPGGDHVVGRLGRLAVRLAACAPGADGFRSDLPPPDEDRAMVVDGDPSPSRARFYRMSEEERASAFGSSLAGDEVVGSASHPDFLLPAGSVLVIPDGEEAYLRGRGWRVCKDRRLLAWDWRGEAGPPLPVGGRVEALSAALGNRSEVPLGAWLNYRGCRWWNTDGSGSLRDETDLEWEDRRDRMRASFWAALREAAPPVESADPLPLIAPVLTPGAWRLYFWTMVGHYMVDDDWSMGLGEWRWIRGVTPRRETPLQSSVRFNVGPESWPSEWDDVVWHDRKWVGDLLPDAIVGHPAVRDLLGYAQEADVEPQPFIDVWVEQVRLALLDMDVPGPGDVPGEPTAHRRSFEMLKRHALDGKSFAEWWAAVEEKLAFDRRERSAWRAEVEAHRAWMRANCRIAYVPDPEGSGPFDGPDARILVRPWSHDFMPEPLVPPACFEMDSSPQVGHDYSTDPDQGNGVEGARAPFLELGHTLRSTLPKVHARVRANEDRRLSEPVVAPTGRQFLGCAGPDDHPSVVRAEAKAFARDPGQLVRRSRFLYRRLERMIDGGADGD